MSQNVILTIHILACIALTVVILLQRSEGGALGIGGGGGSGGLMSGRGTVSALVRTTMIFGGIFMLTTLALTAIANNERELESDVVRADEAARSAPVDPAGEAALADVPAPDSEGSLAPEDMPAPEEPVDNPQ